MKITIRTVMIVTFKSHDEKHNRVAVETIFGVVDAFPPKDESGERLMERLSGMVELAQHELKPS